MGLSQFDEHNPWIDTETIDSGSSLTPNHFFGGQDRQQRIDAIILASDDTVDNLVAFWMDFDFTPTTLVGTVLVPAGAGTDGVIPAIDAVPFLFAASLGITGYPRIGMSYAPVALPSSGKTIWMTSIGGWF